MNRGHFGYLFEEYVSQKTEVGWMHDAKYFYKCASDEKIEIKKHLLCQVWSHDVKTQSSKYLQPRNFHRRF